MQLMLSLSCHHMFDHVVAFFSEENPSRADGIASEKHSSTAVCVRDTELVKISRYVLFIWIWIWIWMANGGC